MRWILAAGPVAAAAGFHAVTGSIHWGILAYHLVCAAGILGGRSLLRGSFRWNRSIAIWSAGVTLLFVGGALLPLLFWDPSPLRETVRDKIFPGSDPTEGFWWMAAYTVFLHVPLEELYWRGVVLGTFRGRGMRMGTATAVNAVFFFALHAIPLHVAGFSWGWLLAVPTGLAGGAWAWIRVRSDSMWPLFLSHAAVCVAILEVVRRFFLS